MPPQSGRPKEIRPPSQIKLGEVFSGSLTTPERAALRFLVNHCNPNSLGGDFEQDLAALTVSDIQNFEVVEFRDKMDAIGTRRYELRDKRTGATVVLEGVAAGTIDIIQKRLKPFGQTFDFKKEGNT